MSFPLHSCDPERPCPVLAGAACEGRDWFALRLKKWDALSMATYGKPFRALPDDGPEQDYITGQEIKP